jgi:hypothetical protein
MVGRTLFGKGIPIQWETKECHEASGKAKKTSEANTEHVLVSPETKEKLEALKFNENEPLGDVVLRDH